MKKMFIPILLILMVLSLLSCSQEIRRMEDGDVNQNIYPYLEFSLSPDRTYYSASVVSGAKLESVSVPGYLHTDFAPMPVKVFKGFENPEDALNLKEVYVDVNIIEIAEDALDYAYSLEKVVVTGIESDSNWTKLPPALKREEYHFEGWKVGDTIYDGESTISLDPETPLATPYFVKLEHHDAVSPNCTEEGNIEYWECSDCHKYFTDSYATNTVTDVSVPASGHYLPLVRVDAQEATCLKDGNIEYYRCDRCGGTFSDEEGNDPIESVIIPQLNYHVSDGVLHTSETYHWYQCIWCGTEIDMDEHTWDDWVITVPATEHTKGSKYHDCEVCRHRITVEIPEHDHIEGEILEVHEATCTEGAYYIEKCGNPECGEIVRFEIEDKPALGHTGYMVEFKDSTCQEEGVLQHFHCTRCNLNFRNQSDTTPMDTVVIIMKDHVWSTKWSESETEHYHLCINCKTAKNDASPHVFDREVTESKYLISSSTCQHANIYKKSCLCGRAGDETFTSGVVGDHSYTKFVPVDYQYHQLVCQWCDTILPGSKEKHEFDDHKVCVKCEYVPVTSEGGFDVVIVDKTPKGHIELISNEGTKKTFLFVNEKSTYPPTKLEWSVEGLLERTDDVTGVTDYSSYSFTASTPYPMTYRITCRYSNETAAGSSTIVVSGGNST